MKLLIKGSLLIFLTTCGGGSGDISLPPSVSLSSSSASVVLNTSVTITWSTTNATSCTAFGAWSGSKSTNGSEDVSISVAGDNSFSLSCTGSGGSRSASTIVASYQIINGIVVDGYIRGSDVFIDTNNNYTKDSSENATTTDYEGKFTNLKYNNGNLISSGGFDLDTGNLLDDLFLQNKLSSHKNFIVITPITTVATFMTDPSTINSALGIDAAININTTDPVANLSTGGIYNHLYEKGNQLAVMALALQNAMNVYNSTTGNTKDYFTGIAQVLEQEYTATPDTVVDIESEAFINKVVDNITATKASTIDSTITTNIKSALKAVIPVIRVMSSASTTKVIQNFAFSTLQTDIKAIATGAASTATLTSYASDMLTYIATDQGIAREDLGWVNTLPIFTSATTFSAAENQTAIGTVTATDADGDPLTYTLTGSDASLITISSSGVMTFNTAPDYETKTSYSITANVSDGQNNVSQGLTISVTDVNDNNPVISSLPTYTAAENQTAIGTVTATDGDASDSVTFTVSGSELSITSAGILTFASAPDYETKYTYTATVTASDGTNSTTQDITINVTDVDEIGNVPVISSLPTYTAAENQTAIGTVTATDADGDPLTYTLTGSDASLITISSSGVMTFNTAPDYETKTSYSITANVSDGQNNVSQGLTISVTDVNDNNPVISSLPTYTAAENQTAIGTVTATDGDASDSVTFTVSGSELSITSAGILIFASAPDYETKTSYSATVTATDGTNSTTQSITVTVTNVDDVAPVFSSSASFSAAENQMAIGTVMETDADSSSVTFTVSGSELSITSAGVLTFASAPDYETKTSYSATVTATDGTNSTTQVITVSITDVNESSVTAVSDAASTNEDTSVTFDPLANDTIVTGGYSVSVAASSANNGSVTVNSGNTLTYTPSLNFFGTDTFTYTATVNSVSGTGSVTVTVNSVNDLPIINSLSSILTPNENQTSVVSINASDVESSSLTYSITGTDASFFNISSSGVITFKSSPDYEAPADSGADNSYTVVITVSDGTASVSQTISVVVQNVPDLVSGVAVDGYVAGATVFQDLDNDGVLDIGEPNASTNAMGSFSLTLSSVNKSAPVRIINGYDLATNEVHPSIMDISVTETGSYIITPISTLVGRLKIQDSTLTGNVPESIIAAALGINLSDSPNDSILGFDPISYFTGSDATLASESKPIFGASQLLMALGGGNYPVNKYIIDQVLATLSTTLTNASSSSITMNSASDLTAIKQDAYDAIFNGYVDIALANNPPINYVQFKNNKAVMTDYLNGSSSSQVEYSLHGVHDGSSTLVADLVGVKLDYENLKQILDNEGTGTPMDLSFELSSLPIGSGTTAVTMKLFYGNDIIQGSNEDYLQVALTANWESDGSTLSIKLPADSNLVAKFFDRGGTILTKTVTNLDEDIFTVDQDGPNRPGNLKLRLSQLFTLFPSQVSKLSTYLDGNSEFTYFVEMDDFTIYDHLGNTFNKIQGTFGVTSNSAIAMTADDIYIHENTTSQNLTFRLSQASSSDVTVDYAIASGSTASSSDYTLNSGTVTIPAGSTSATLAVTVTNDTVVESQEEIKLTLSNPQNAVLSRSSVSVYITDGEEILSNNNQRAILADNVYKDSKQSINAYIKNKLDTSTVTISGTAYTYSQVLINNSITSDVNAYVDSIVDDYEIVAEALVNAVMTKTNLFVDAELSGFTTYLSYAQKLTQLISGLKGLNVSQIVGTNINANGTYPSGQTAATLQTAMNGQVDMLVSLATDTVADILGIDTNTNFPNANVMIGTDGDDTITGTSGSDLIATFNGADTVNAAAGNDKVLGGQGVDTFNGQDGNDHLYGYAGNDVLTGGAGDDKVLGGLGNDTINGGAGDDDLRGETGNDTITSGAGSDTITGGLGDDTINIDGAGTKTADGGAGTDSLTINVSGITSLKDLTLSSYSSGELDYIKATDASRNEIDFTRINFLTVNSISYAFAPSTTINSGDGGISNAFYSTSQKTIHSYGSTIWYAQNICSGDHTLGFNCSDDIEYIGSASQETLNLNINRSAGNYTGDLTIDLKDGNDSINSAKLINTDSIDLGAGNDSISVMFGADAGGYQTIQNASISKLDGGSGTDTLSFGESANPPSSISLTTAGATNFENLTGTTSAETLNGDANANILIGNSGADTLNGNGGNDTLYAQDQGYGGASSTDSDDNLYGGAGNDILYASAGDNTLDGGTGADTIYSGNGSDTIVIRSGDGGSSVSDADTLADFSDGADAIGLDSSLGFSDLTIAASGSDTVISAGSEYLMKLLSFSSSNLTYLDFQSTSTDAQTFNGTSSNDVLIGGAGVDTFNGGAGSDTLVGWGGNDIFNIASKSGSYADTIIGGAGTDTLNIAYTGISSLKDFTLSSSGSDITATDSSGGSVTFNGIEALTVNSISYAFAPSTAINSGDGGISNAFYSTSQKTIHSYGSTVWYAQNICSGDHTLGFNCSDDIEYIGSASQETLNLNINRVNYTGDLTIDLKDGNDSINSAKLINTDSIDMGAGDDTVSVMFGADAGGYQTIQNASISKLDGGAGTDTLSFGESANPPTTISLTTAGATNFENLTGTTSAETLNGDANANILIGNSGADTLNGNGGNDTLYAQDQGYGGASSTDSDDNLYGGSGNDILYGSAGDNTLDGGTGADTIYSGGGSDTIVIRSGDGGSAQSDSDTVSDFTDGTDSIGLDTITYGALTIAQVGSDTVIKEGSNFLTTLTGISASAITAADFQSTSTSAVTYTGTSGNDTMVGGAGGDTFNGGAGSDILLGWGGNDTFNIRSKSGTYVDAITGGAGTDTLNIAYTGISSLKDFTLSSSGSDITATDSSGGSVTFNGIEALTVNSISYAFAPSTAINSGDGGISNAFYSTSQKTIHSYGSTVWYAQNICSGDHTLGFNCSDDIEYIGSASQETLNLNINRVNYTGDLTIDLKDGNDSINSAKLINTDSIDMGAGDDTVSVMFGADAGGYQTIQNASISKLDGGAGTDTLSFGESANPPTTISLTTAGATNFENLTGTTSAETLNGDANANILIGNSGADTLNGNGGNDTLYAQDQGYGGASSTDSDDNLYGGAGNDILYASAGDNTLDGGTGADTIYSGNGSDTIVIRSGDGGSSVSDADTLADFSDGVDLIGLSNLQYSDLTVEQGTGSYSSHVIVKKTDTGEYLIIIQNTSLSNIDDNDFTAI